MSVAQSGPTYPSALHMGHTNPKQVCEALSVANFTTSDASSDRELFLFHDKDDKNNPQIVWRIDGVAVSAFHRGTLCFYSTWGHLIFPEWLMMFKFMEGKREYK